MLVLGAAAGLSSYCLVLMIVAFLRINKVPTVSVEQERYAWAEVNREQEEERGATQPTDTRAYARRRETGGRGSPPPASSSASAPGLKEEENLGAALLGFLRFFGLQFDFDKMGISLHNGGCVSPVCSAHTRHSPFWFEPNSPALCPT